jgi:hypothetical protein
MFIKKINKFQKKLLENSKKYLSTENKKGIDISVGPLCFLTPWAKTPGKLKLDLMINKKIDLKSIIKNILNISKNHDLNVFFNKSIKKKKKINLIISYATKENFDKLGNYFDNYFDMGYNHKKIIWLLISLDNYVPQNIQNNIFLIAKSKNQSLSFLYLIKKIFKLIYKSRLKKKFLIHYCWYEYDFAEKVSNIFFELFSKDKIKNVIFNYESVPFQNKLLKTIKQIDKNIKTIGYLHCAPWPLQTDLIYRKFLLDVLLVSGEDQKEVLKKHLGWKNVDIKVIPSLRFKKKKFKEFNGFIFIPYNLNSNNNYVERFEKFIKTHKFNFYNLKVRIHPLNKNSKIHLDLKEKFDQLLKKCTDNFGKKNSNFSIFFGSATGVCVQALEEGTKIIHFPDNEIDVFSNKIWKNIIVNSTQNMVFSYEIKNFNKIFYTSFENNKFKKYVLI